MELRNIYLVDGNIDKCSHPLVTASSCLSASYVVHLLI